MTGRHKGQRLEATLNYTTMNLGKVQEAKGLLEDAHAKQLEFFTGEQNKYQSLRQKLLITMLVSLLIAAGSVIGLVIGILLLYQH